MTMPDWLSTLLLVLVILVALYLVAVIAQIILARLLRRQAEPMRRSIEVAQREIASARSKLDDLAPAINGGPKEMPFGPLYDQARLLLKRGMANVNEVQTRLARIVAEEIPEQPWSAALQLVPMTVEVAKRLKARRGVKTVTVHLTEVNDTLNRIQTLQTEIGALPAREQEAVLKLQHRAAEAAATIEAETRPKRPLTEERSTWKQASALVEQASALLADPNPSQPNVIVAYSLRTKANEHLLVLDKMLTDTTEQRTRAEAAVTQSSEALQSFQHVIAEDEKSGNIRSRFRRLADQLADWLAELRARVEQGEYEIAQGELAEFENDLVTQRSALDALNRERARVVGLANSADQQLHTLTRWIEEASPRFDLDEIGSAARQLQHHVEQLRRLIPLEAIEGMTAAAEHARQAETIFAQAGQAHERFIAARARLDEIGRTLNDESVTALESQAARLAEELRSAHHSYWGELTPDVLTAAADELTNAWQAIRPKLDAIKQSMLVEVLEQVEAAFARFDHANRWCQQAAQALMRRDADRLQATAALDHAALAGLLIEADRIGAESPSQAAPPQRFRVRAGALRAELRAPAPDYRHIHASAAQLHAEVEGFVAGYQQRVQQVRGQLGLLKYRLLELREGLGRLNDDPRIAFAASLDPLAHDVDAWLAGFDSAADAPLDAAQAALAAGEEVERAALTQLNTATQVQKQINEAIASLKTALAETNGILSAAQAGLHAMAEIGGERWGQTMLDPACEQLTEALEQLAKLDRPSPKLAPEAAQAAVTRLKAMTTTARERAAEAHADIARRVDEARDRRTRLSQALTEGEAIAAANAQWLEDWQLVRRQVSGLEQRWTNATSYAEAVEAMAQAIQRIQRFIELHAQAGR